MATCSPQEPGSNVAEKWHLAAAAPGAGLDNLPVRVHKPLVSNMALWAWGPPPAY